MQENYFNYRNTIVETLRGRIITEEEIPTINNPTTTSQPTDQNTENNTDIQNLSEGDDLYDSIKVGLNERINNMSIVIDSFTIDKSNGGISASLVGTIQKDLQFYYDFHDTDSGVIIKTSEVGLKLNSSYVKAIQTILNFYDVVFTVKIKESINNN